MLRPQSPWAATMRLLLPPGERAPAIPVRRSAGGKRRSYHRAGRMSHPEREMLMEDLILRIIADRDAGATVDVAANAAMNLIRERDPSGQHRAYLVSELTREIDGVPEMSYAADREVLRRLIEVLRVVPGGCA